jgi:hypothetical protein
MSAFGISRIALVAASAEELPGRDDATTLGRLRLQLGDRDEAT